MNNSEELSYLLMFLDNYIENLIYDVLHDSEDDPQYSAVSTSNLIKCYIKTMNELGCKLEYSNVKEYFEYNLFTQNEYQEFIKKYEVELKYYIGKIY